MKPLKRIAALVVLSLWFSSSALGNQCYDSDFGDGRFTDCDGHLMSIMAVGLGGLAFTNSNLLAPGLFISSTATDGDVIRIVSDATEESARAFFAGLDSDDHLRALVNQAHEDLGSYIGGDFRAEEVTPTMHAVMVVYGEGYAETYQEEWFQLEDQDEFKSAALDLFGKLSAL